MLLTMNDGAGGIVQFITVLFIFVLVLALTLVVTRWLGKYQRLQSRGGNIRIMETVKISPSAYVEILKIGKNRYVAVAVGKENASLLCELSESDIDFTPADQGEAFEFDNILSKLKGKYLLENSNKKERSKEDE